MIYMETQEELLMIIAPSMASKNPVLIAPKNIFKFQPESTCKETLNLINLKMSGRDPTESETEGEV
jgi:hypothetical protein